MSIDYPFGLNEAEFDQLDKIMDEFDDYHIYRHNYYVLKNADSNQELKSRLITNLQTELPLDELKKGHVENPEGNAFVLTLEGNYFPDYLATNGVHLVSAQLWEYLNQWLNLDDLEHHPVVLQSTANQRVEEYHLLVPPELNVIIIESARYDQNGNLEYFELDEEAIGSCDLFKIKDFPYLIVTEKLNRIDYDLECLSLEKYCGYQVEQVHRYQERLTGKLQEKTYRVFQKNAAHGVIPFGIDINNVLYREESREEIREGFAAIFASYNGTPLTCENLCDQTITFEWKPEESVLRLENRWQTYFSQTSMVLKRMNPVRDYLSKLPMELLSSAQEYFRETLLQLLIVEISLFVKYDQVHANQRWRLFFYDPALKIVNPVLLYDYKCQFQRDVEEAADLSKFNFNDRDLREYDFSGKNLSGLKFNGCNLRLTKFTGANLTNAEFTSCLLQGTDFSRANLQGAGFHESFTDRINFDGSNLKNAVFSGADLCHCRFVKSDCTGLKVENPVIAKAYFYKAKLTEAVFETGKCFYYNVFRCCLMARTQFINLNPESLTPFISACDFRNADLSESRFGLAKVKKTRFIQAKLNAADFSICRNISECDFRYSDVTRVDFGAAKISNSNLAYLDLSIPKIRSGVLFSGNDCSHANLSRYDFTVAGYTEANILRCANLTHSNLSGADLQTSDVEAADFTDAILTSAIFAESQLDEVQLSTKQKEVILIVTDKDGTDDDDDYETADSINDEDKQGDE